MKTINLLAILIISLIYIDGIAQIKYFWKFDENQEIEQSYGERWSEYYTRESITKSDFVIKGLAKYVPGVSGSAIQFDGFSAYVEGLPGGSSRKDSTGEVKDIPPLTESLPSKKISVEAWIALGAYPWNWAPIITIGKYKITGFYFGIDSRGRLGFHMSDATSVWHQANSKLNENTSLGMALHKWHHVVGTYSPEKGLAVYIDGELKGTYNNFQFDYGVAYSDLDKSFRMGRNREDLAPSEPIRDWATYPSRYTLDGIVDEVKIHAKTLNAEEVTEIYKSTNPENEPLFHPRKFPSIKPAGRFAANYTRLNYYPEWDALWPVGDYMDVVVQFDELPTKVMFWRGTRYSACLVSENGWLTKVERQEITGFLNKAQARR
jgi:hypothetical protein